MDNYSIQVSIDGSAWTEVSAQTTQMGYPSVIDMNQVEARYVRLVQRKNTFINFAEVEIFGQLAEQQLSLSPSVVAGKVVVTQDTVGKWTPVTFDQPFAQAPVVIAGPVSFNGADPTFAAVRNVTAQGFEIQAKEWDYLDGTHITETIDFLAVLPGTHNDVEGLTFFAGAITVDEVFQSLSFNNSFAEAPAVFTQLQIGSSTYQSAVPRARNVSTNSVEVMLQEQEGHDGDHWYDRVNVIAVSQGLTEVNGKEIVVGGANVNHAPNTIGFGNDMNAPLFFNSMQTFNGGDTAAGSYCQK